MSHPDDELFAECEWHRRCECAGCVAFNEAQEMARICRVIDDKKAGKPEPRVDSIAYENTPLYGLIKKGEL